MQELYNDVLMHYWKEFKAEEYELFSFFIAEIQDIDYQYAIKASKDYEKGLILLPNLTNYCIAESFYKFETKRKRAFGKFNAYKAKVTEEFGYV